MIKTSFVLLIVFFAACQHIMIDDKKQDTYPLYETSYTHYYDGQILLPDYVHSDTLVVISSKFLNWAMEHYDAASDGDISDILGEGTTPLADYADYIQVTSNLKDTTHYDNN